MEREFNEKMIKSIYKNEVRCPENKTAKMMRDSILDARKKGDSLGGIIESVTTNVPVGLGEPIFSSLESDLSKAIFSIPSVKELNLVQDLEVQNFMVLKIMTCIH